MIAIFYANTLRGFSNTSNWGVSELRRKAGSGKASNLPLWFKCLVMKLASSGNDIVRRNCLNCSREGKEVDMKLQNGNLNVMVQSFQPICWNSGARLLLLKKVPESQELLCAEMKVAVVCYVELSSVAVIEFGILKLDSELLDHAELKSKTRVPVVRGSGEAAATRKGSAVPKVRDLSIICARFCDVIYIPLVPFSFSVAVVTIELSPMSFRSIVRDVRDSFGSLSRRSFEVRLSGFNGRHKGKSQVAGHEVHEPNQAIQQSCWASLPPELLHDVIRRLDESEPTWPSRKSVIFCAAVCKSWRQMCKEIVQRPEHSGKLTFPVSLKQPGARDGMIQCFIKRDKSRSTYHLYLCLSPGKVALSSYSCFTFVASFIDVQKVEARKSNLVTFIWHYRSNFVGTNFRIYDTQPPYDGAALSPPGGISRRWYSKKVSPKVPSGSYPIGQVTYRLNVLGTRGPRRMQCVMHSIPVSALVPGGTVPGQPDNLVTRSLEDSFRSLSSISSYMDQSSEFSSARFCNITQEVLAETDVKMNPLVLHNKQPRWHEQLQCWCLNFRGRVTIASVKNFQLIAATQPATATASLATASQPAAPGRDKILLQFGKVAKDTFTMDYRYPLSAFQAFAICLSSFDTKLACE
ncbi:hypothetical protein ZIOFF_038986 [Zingiber officinale]|uniref:Tubby-like F-box protein n=1 Tax=Zingiber officinale TaxID=94328 RepID=A0A8J5G6K8_ZINOF|nr:hypothetical protein ZIOFF_038986 [Zingiber officinale]